MTTKTLSLTQAGAFGSLLPLLGAAALGIGLIVLSGHVQAATLHDAAHDVRHATGFPCH